MPSTATAKSAAETHEDGSPVLYRHRRRPEWGVALLAWEGPDKRAYQFDDGRLRIMKKGFYELMEVAEAKEGVGERMVSDLEANLEARKKPPLEKVYSFGDQLRIFKKLFPKGFDGEKWQKRRRGVGNKQLKRHRNAAIEIAQEKLKEKDLRKLVDDGKEEVVLERAIEVLECTDLVRIKKVRELEKFDDKRKKEAGKALFELLYGDGRYGLRFRAWLDSLRKGLPKEPSWRLATTLPALVHPEEQICVRPSTFKRQAAAFAPGKSYSKRPRRGSYKNFLRVAERTAKRLESEGYEPQDMLDVHDFIWVTLRPSAAKHLDSGA